MPGSLVRGEPDQPSELRLRLLQTVLLEEGQPLRPGGEDRRLPLRLRELGLPFSPAPGQARPKQDGERDGGSQRRSSRATAAPSSRITYVPPASNGPNRAVSPLVGHRTSTLSARAAPPRPNNSGFVSDCDR